MARVLYNSTNEFIVHKMDFSRYDASSLKSQREDFNDMFYYEAEYRRERGDLSLVFVLTYNDEHLRKYMGHNMLDSDDLKVYAKSSKWSKMLLRTFGYTFDFVCVGEFGNGGDSHNYNGKRGKGENPHFHCVGWFHQVSTPRPDSVEKLAEFDIKSTDPKVYLPLLVRYAWQGSVVDTLVFDKDFYLRKLGLGHVTLDGEIISSSKGGSYISKYLGKDFKALNRQCFTDGFLPYVMSILRDWCVKKKYAFDVLGMWMNYRRNFPIDALNLCGFMHFCLRFNGIKPRPLFNACYSQFLKDFQELDDLFIDIYEEFQSFMHGRYSPKVRKFHGFGYRLLSVADVDNGTYRVVRKGVEITRNLPPSIARWCYYDHLVINDQFGNKIVKYILNDLGRIKLGNALRSAIGADEVIACRGSEVLRDNWLAASIFLHCMSTYDVKVGGFGAVPYVAMLERCDINVAIRYACKCRCTSVYEIPQSLMSVTLIDIVCWLKDKYPVIYAAYSELKDLHKTILRKKDEKDSQYNALWQKLYMFNS